MSDVISLAQFQQELRRIARFSATEAIANPLAAVVQKISDNPHLSQARVLCRLLKALINQYGEFRRADACAFDGATLRVVIALMNASSAGTDTRAEWFDALTAAERASSA